MSTSSSVSRFVVTGSASGLGRSVTDLLLATGATGVGLDLDYGASTLPDEDRFHPLACDVSSEASVADGFRRAEEILGGIDVLVNCAGILIRQDWDTTTVEAWDRVMGVNALGTFLCLQRAASVMIRQRVPGRIVNVSSLAVRLGGHTAPIAYTASKAAVIGVTRGMALHLAPHRIQVNCVAPGPIDTNMICDWTPATRDAFIAATPLRMMLSPEMVAELIVFLASEKNAMITGQTFDINGGRYFH